LSRRCRSKTPVRTQVLLLRAPEEVVNTALEITEEKKEAVDTDTQCRLPGYCPEQKTTVKIPT